MFVGSRACAKPRLACVRVVESAGLCILSSLLPTATPSDSLSMSLPQASSSSTLNTHRIANARRPAQLRFHVSTASASISDLRLQVCALSSGGTAEAEHEEESKAVLRPSYFRERTLALNDEIVDQVVDATTGSVMWTVHRPVRG